MSTNAQTTESARIITFAAYKPKKTGPLPLSPLEDRQGRLFTGQGRNGTLEGLTTDEKAKLDYVVDRRTKVTIEDGMTFDLSDPINAINWVWMQKHLYLATDYEKGLSSRDAVFYVINRKNDAERRVKSTKDIDTARMEVRGLPIDKLRKAAKVLDLRSADSFSEIELLDWMLQYADTHQGALAVLGAIDPAKAELNAARSFFNLLKRYNLVDKDEAGMWLYGTKEQGVRLGHTDDAAIEWLFDRKNADMVRILRTRVREEKERQEGVGANEEVSA